MLPSTPLTTVPPPPSLAISSSSPAPPNPTTFPIPPTVLSAITDAKARGKSVAVMLCGLSGSGKSTLARNLCACASLPQFTRLSIDACIYEERGTSGVDFAGGMEAFGALGERAEEEVKARLRRILEGGGDGDGDGNGGEKGERGRGDVVLDMSFWSRRTRDEYRGLVEDLGGAYYEVVMVVFRGSEEVLWRRIEGRRKGWEESLVSGEEVQNRGETGWEGISIEREVLRGWLEGFEWPTQDEGTIIEVEVV